MRLTKLWSGISLAAAIAASGGATAAAPVAGDPVLYWNDVAFGLVGGGVPAQARVMAILNAAMHDAVNRTYNGANHYYSLGVAAPGGNVRAAASAAAHRVLTVVDPANAARYDAALADSLVLVGNGATKSNGVTTGIAYADAMLAARALDGSGAVVPYTPGIAPGAWRPTPPGNASAVLPHWGGVTPFLTNASDQFRPAPPPALDSAVYAAAYNEVKEIGSLTSMTRTADQTASALFWDASNGLTWIRIGADIIADDGLSTLESARVMAKLSAAVADSLISGWEAKYHYGFWRPVTAIREGDADGNADTLGDPGWSPLFATPAHPSYPSGHSLQSGAATSVLLGLTADQAFCNTIGTDSRCFTGLSAAGLDAANSRLWGGIHFRFDNETGFEIGQAVGRWALAQDAFNAVPEPAAWGMMIARFVLAGSALRRRTGATCA